MQETAIELSEKGYLAAKRRKREKRNKIFIVFLWRLGIWPKPHTILLKNVKRLPATPSPWGYWELWAKRDTRVLGRLGVDWLTEPGQGRHGTWDLGWNIWFVDGHLVNKASEICLVLLDLQQCEKQDTQLALGNKFKGKESWKALSNLKLKEHNKE